jgi:hypothetical protein
LHAASAHYAPEAEVSHSASRVRLSAIAAGLVLLTALRAAEAQDARPPAAVETWVGYGWVDDDSGNHGVVGAGMRFYLSPRFSLSPRVTYGRTFRETPEDHTEVDLETVLTFEFRRPANGRPRMLSPFFLVSGGVRLQRFHEIGQFRDLTRTERFWGATIGARLFLPFARGRMYVAPEVGVAPLIFPHTRQTEDPLIAVAAPVTVGITLGEPDDLGNRR